LDDEIKLSGKGSFLQMVTWSSHGSLVKACTQQTWVQLPLARISVTGRGRKGIQPKLLPPPAKVPSISLGTSEPLTTKKVYLPKVSHGILEKLNLSYCAAELAHQIKAISQLSTCASMCSNFVT